MTVLLSIFLLSIVASFIQRTTGFGFGIFIMTMLPFLMPSYAEATTLTGLLAMSNSIYIAIRMHRYVQWRRVVPILCAFVVVSTLSIFCLLNSATLLIVSGHCGQNRPECDFSCSNWLFAIS